MKVEDPVLRSIKKFFSGIFILRKRDDGYAYADYDRKWLRTLELTHRDRDEAKASRTTKELQKRLKKKFGHRIKTEAPVAEGMTLRFEAENEDVEDISIDSNKLQAFDILDVEAGTAYEISLSDAFAEFFKDVLKALLDSRVKKLYICMRNHNYKGAGKSGYLKVKDSVMVQQYISLAKLYKLDIHLVDLFPKCNIAMKDK
jgi:hypothetical protein